MKDHAIILAAGASRRMGRPKALLEFEGQTLLERALGAVLAAKVRPWVVIGAGADMLIEHLEGVDYVIHQGWAEGMGTSIAAGIRALPGTAERAGVVAVDQPHIDGRHLSRLFNACTGSFSAAATRYPGDELGVPAVFARPWFEALGVLNQDIGARDLLRSGLFEVASVEGADPGDVDTREAWNHFVREHT